MINFPDADAKRLFGQFQEEQLKRFKKFNTQNPHIYDAFVERARQMKKAGHKRYSASAIIQRIRWEMDITTKGSRFKIDDSFTTFYGRLADYLNDDLKDFFEYRK